MKLRIMSVTEKVQFGYNYAVTVDYTDLNTIASGNTGSFNLLPYQGTTQGGSSDAGTTLVAGTRMKLIGMSNPTGFAFSDSGNACSITVGDSGSANRYLASTALISGGNTAYSIGTGTEFVLTTADNFIVAFTGQSGKQLNLATAGSVTFYLKADDMTQWPTP